MTRRRCRSRPPARPSDAMNVVRSLGLGPQRTTGYALADISYVLRELEVQPGSTVMMHSSLMRLGRIDDVPVADYPAAVVGAVRDHLGPDGTLVVPAPNWDYGAQREPFDIERSPVSKPLGVVSAYVNELPDRQRSANPIFSVAALGANAEQICGGSTANAFGFGSPWHSMLDLEAEQLGFGTDFEFLTCIRFAEFLFGVPYLYNKYFDVPLLNDGVPVPWPVVAPLRYAHLPIRYAPEKPHALCRAHGVLREVTLGGGRVMAINIADFLRVTLEALEDDIHFFLAEVPSYSGDQIPRV